MYSVEGKAEIFADCMEEQFTVLRDVSDRTHDPHLLPEVQGLG